MKYHYTKPTEYSSMYGQLYECNHPAYKKTMRDLHNICAMNGFVIQGRVVLQDKTNGKVWR